MIKHVLLLMHAMKMAKNDRDCGGEKNEVEQKCRRQFSLRLFLHSVNRKHHGKCIRELNGMCLSGNSSCPNWQKK